ncbi:MAG: cyanophycinase [Clostridia bacterium]|nr:cyanophycinase [Clostridia bacterium]
MPQYSVGILVIIGGAEDKENKCLILKRVTQLAGGQEGRLVLISTATENPEEVGEEYKRIFLRLGLKRVINLCLSTREQAEEQKAVEEIRGATAIFFTGGDQLRITSILGGTAVDLAVYEAYRRGTVIAGTSAGASAMSNTMIVEGNSDEGPKQNTVKMAPGLGLLDQVVIDQHFAQRGRLGRLLAAVAQNPNILGIGIDEDTAIEVNKGLFRVIGSQTVTIIDGRQILYTNASEADPRQPLALSNVTLHVLPPGYGYDLRTRQPLLYKVSDNEEEKPCTSWK